MYYLTINIAFVHRSFRTTSGAITMHTGILHALNQTCRVVLEREPSNVGYAGRQIPNSVLQNDPKSTFIYLYTSTPTYIPYV